MKYFSKIKIGLVLFATCLFLLNKKSCAQCRQQLDTIPCTFVVTLKSEGHSKLRLLQGYQVFTTLADCSMIDTKIWLKGNKQRLGLNSLYVHYIFNYKIIQ